MEPALVAVLAAGMLAAAFVYAAVGHGGASAYLAVMALAGIAPAEMRPVALALNLAVAAIAAASFWRAGHFRWSLFWPFALASVPAAFFGGAITLPGSVHRLLVGIVLLYAAAQMWATSAQAGAEVARERAPPLGAALVLGAAIGLLAGLTGVGGGIFLSPLLLFFRWADAKKTSALAAPFIFVNSAAALVAGFSKNPVSLPEYTGWLLAAVVAGGLAGARCGARRFASTRLRKLLAVVLAIAGAKMVLV